MLFDSSLRKELARSFAATLVVILTIVITMMLIRTIGQAAAGQVGPQDVVLLLGYAALAHLPTMLSLSLFIAVVLTLGRMYRDSEIVVWFASGIGLARFVRPVLWTAAPVLVVVAVLMLVVWPWVNRQSSDLRDRYQQRSDLARVAPGVFQTSADGRRVFFVERESVDGINARNVFILNRVRESESVTSARSGRIEERDDDRYLVLERGQRNEVDLRSGEHTLSAFEAHRVLVDQQRVRRAQARPPKAMGTLELALDRSARNDAELAWRLGMVLAGANLLLLGVGLAASNPRRPTNWNLVFALLTFVVYFNLVNLSQGWVATGRVSMGAALVALHAGAFALALLLLWWRDHASTFSLARRRGVPAPVR
jgi:lipopolysaccharide export system permease protein